MGPMVPAKIELQNPVTDAWSNPVPRLHRRRSSGCRTGREQHANVTLELVDGLAFLAACEMAPNGDFGDGVDDGNIIFLEDEDLDAVQTRINKVLDQADWPGALRGDLHRQRRPAAHRVRATLNRAVA